MNKEDYMKKNIFISIFVLFILIFILCVVKNISKISKEEMQNFIKESKTSSNMEILADFVDFSNGEEKKYSYNSYLKDNVQYIKGIDKEGNEYQNIYNYNNSEKISIIPQEKVITKTKITQNNFSNGLFVSEYDLIYSLTDYNYRYLEKTITNNSQCYKFALSKQIDDNSQEQYIFYINIENHSIVKCEMLLNDKVILESNYKYIYDKVKDNDILSIDDEKFADYKIIE